MGLVRLTLPIAITCQLTAKGGGGGRGADPVKLNTACVSSIIGQISRSAHMQLQVAITKRNGRSTCSDPAVGRATEQPSNYHYYTFTKIEGTSHFDVTPP